jgi:radical SAM superfamily enzyme YgiQ (UPF0313 family)
MKKNMRPDMHGTDVLLIYPQLGSWDTVVRDIPLSLIYAAADSVKKGYRVRIADLRLAGGQWREMLDRYLRDGCALAGVSVMTGNPIKTSLMISRYIKEKYGIPIVWGGPHPTILPEQTLENPYIDYVIRDWGSRALCRLAGYVKGDSSDRRNILGLGYKENGAIILNEPQTCFEMPDFHDLPYDLVDMSGQSYSRFKTGELVFPVFTSMGCPYQCNFCMSPAVYRKISGKKWIGFDVENVLDHIEYVSGRYRFKRIQIYDDVSFVDLERMRRFLSGYIRRGYNKKYTLDFRGARINELDRMDDDFLCLLVEANVELILTGMESGSSRVLRLMNKGITVEQVISVNRKLARFPSLKPNYNFFCGIPGETLDDLMQTKNLLQQLVREHPGCYLGYGAHWKPIPGSALTETAVKEYGFTLPSSLEEWSDIDSLDAKTLVHPWYTPATRTMIDLLGVTGMVLDRKAEDLTGNLGPVIGRAVYCLIRLYRPLLRLRLKYNLTGFLLEPGLNKFFITHVGRLLLFKKTFLGQRKAER